MMDKSWVHLDRRSEEYTVGIRSFVGKAIENSSRPNLALCPCRKCCNRYYKDAVNIEGDLLWFGMDPIYMNTRWTHHGEPNTDWRDEEVVVTGEMHEVATSEMHQFLNDTFMQPLTRENNGSSTNESSFDGQSLETRKFYRLVEDANKELYPGCSIKKLDAVVKLYQAKCLGGVTNKAFSMFLKLFKEMLPDGECLPPTFFKTKRLIEDLGLTSETIDACPNDCMLFWKDTALLKECLRCGTSRYTVNKKTGKQNSAKVLRYFPLIPRLKRLYLSRHIAEHMRWHATECPKDGFMRHPSDSPAWKHLDELYPDFGSEMRNVRLGLASDGFNPFGNMSNGHSSWPVIISVYNLPPWMCMKRSNMFMSLLIPGPHAPGNDIDVYLQPLVEELNELWQVGVNTYDVFSNEMFNMKAALLWTINDFPAYANLSGWSTKGKLACPHCMHETCSDRLKASYKHCYLGHRKFLPIRHRFRTDVEHFNGQCERRQAPVPLTGLQCLVQLSNLTFTFGKTLKTHPGLADKVVGQKRKRKTRAAPNETTTRENNPWKKKSIFFTLPYWQHLLIRHNLDVMHIEKNICEKIVGTLLGLPGKTKDGLAARLDLERMNIKSGLHPIEEGDKTYLPPAIFHMTNEEKTLFCKVLSDIRVPDGYSADLSRCVNVEERKMHGLKSHDYHVIMQQLLPLAIRKVLPKHVTLVLLELSAIFRQLCSKKETEASFKQLKSRSILALCHLEKMFPPSFFDVMVHLLAHLADEAAIAGPVHYRWMYPIERYLHGLKQYVRNKSRPEGSIAAGYIAEEALSFCTIYLSDVETRRTRLGRNQDIYQARDVPGGLSIFASPGHSIGERKRITLQRDFWDRCRRAVLFNCKEVAPFLKTRLNELKVKFPRETERALENLRNKDFPAWFQKHVNDLYAAGDSSISEDLRRLANGPRITANQYKRHTVNGWRFRTQSVDETLVTQNCGVLVSAEVSSYNRATDNNPVLGAVNYFGVIQDIYELNYGFPGEPDDLGCKVVLFNCDWASSTGKKFDKYGFTLVNFRRLSKSKDSFILASDAIQVFYVPDPKERDWAVMVKAYPRDLFDVLEDNDGSDDLDDPLSFDDYYDTPNLDDPELDKEEVQVRTDVRGVYVKKKQPLRREIDTMGGEDEFTTIDDEDEFTTDDEDDDFEDQFD